MAHDQDRRAAVTAGCGVTVVALTAALVSFSHIRHLAIEAGETELASWLLPISVDGAIVAAVAVILADSRAGRRPAGLTWLLLALGLLGSLAANIASAEPTMTARAVAAWPPVALALGIEVLAGLARRAEGRWPRVGRLPEGQDGALVRSNPAHAGGRVSASSAGSGSNGTRPAPAASGSNGTRPAPAASGSNGSIRLAGRRHLSDSEAVSVIRQLDAAAGGRVSRLQIQQRLGCGGSKAARLADLARGADAVAVH
jgi:hypothetical protein